MSLKSVQKYNVSFAPPPPMKLAALGFCLLRNMTLTKSKENYFLYPVDFCICRPHGVLLQQRQEHCVQDIWAGSEEVLQQSAVHLVLRGLPFTSQRWVTCIIVSLQVIFRYLDEQAKSNNFSLSSW